MTLRCPNCKEELSVGMFTKKVSGMRCEKCHLEWTYKTMAKYKDNFVNAAREPLP